MELFEYVWDTRPRTCFVTGESLERFNGGLQFLSLFAHVLRKSSYPEFRLYVNNIVLLRPDVHYMFDNAELDKILKFEEETGKTFAILFSLEENIYREYQLEIRSPVARRKILDRYWERKRKT